MNIVIIGLSITSSWGNGHATTYRGLLRELVRRGHQVLFLERDVPWYETQRDYSPQPGVEVALYRSLQELQGRFANEVDRAHAVIVGSYVPEGIAVCEWVLATARGAVAFYDIDTPVTLSSLERENCEYLAKHQIPRFHLYLSFAGGKTLHRLEEQYGAREAKALYCSVDPGNYYPEAVAPRWDLGYLGTYSDDRQAGLDRLLVEPARAWPEGKFMVAGPQYPDHIAWPPYVGRQDHLPPGEHRRFYNSQRFTLNITRADMIAAGHSPSVRLFEAAACGTPIISDYWEGLEDFLQPGSEILIANTTREALACLKEMSAADARAIGEAGRTRILSSHTAAHRAAELETMLEAARRRLREPLAV